MKYLCHYTKSETAKLIIKNMTLKFGKIKSSNDPIEIKKPYVVFSSTDEEETNNTIEFQVKSYLNETLQFICFSIGTIENINCNILTYNKIRDFMDDEDTIEDAFLDELSKRPPYYLPRSWAQYGENNKGVCLIFNKDKLTKQIQKQTHLLYYLKHKKIKYIDILRSDLLSDLDFVFSDYEFLDEPHKNVKEVVNKTLKSKSDFIYFTKDIYWRDEREYRFLLWNMSENDNYENVFIKIDNESLIGVVLGLYNEDCQLIKLAKEHSLNNILKLKYDNFILSIENIEPVLKSV